MNVLMNELALDQSDSRNGLFLYPIISRLDLSIHAKRARQHKRLNRSCGRSNEKPSIACWCEYRPMNEGWLFC